VHARFLAKLYRWQSAAISSHLRVAVQLKLTGEAVKGGCEGDLFEHGGNPIGE